MLQCDFKIYNLPFEYPFRIAKGVKTHQATMIVYLGLGAQYGLGEATAIHYYDMSIERLQNDLNRVLAEIRRYAYNGPQRFWHFLHHLIPDNNFLVSALDCASWDLHAKLQGKKVSDILNLQGNNIVPTDYTIGIGSVEETKIKVETHPYPIYKVKLNGSDDLNMLKWLIDHTKATIRLDINEGWTITDAENYLPILNPDRIDLIEQPFSTDNVEALIKFKSMTSIPIFADEAIRNVQDLDKYLQYYDGAVIKLSKCGGITPALKMIEIIQSNNKKIMLGSMNESSVGAAAIAQFMAIADYADIDGPLLHTEFTARGFELNQEGIISLTNGNGIGVAY